MQIFSTDVGKRLFISSLLLLAVALGAGCTGGGDDAPAAQRKPSIAGTPSNLTAVPGNNQVSLTWDVVQGVSSYNIYWSTESGVSRENGQVLTGVSSGYIHQQLTNSQAYYYIVAAVNSGGESLPSEQIMAIPGGQLINSTFPDSNLTHCINQQISGDVAGYAASVTGAVDCSFRGITDITGIEYLTSVQQLNLSNNTIQNIEDLTNLVSLTEIDLSNNNLGPASQEIIEGILGFPGLVRLALDGNSLLSCSYLTQLINTTSVLDITAVDEGNNCTVYSQLPTPTDPLVPSEVKAIAGDGKVTLVWNPVSNADSYNVYWSTNAGVVLDTANRIEGVQSLYVHDGLSNFTSYYYKITAVIGTVESQPSEEVLAIPDDTGTPLGGLFADQQLQVCVDETASAKGWTFAHEVAGTLDCSSRSIQNIQGIENFIELSSLNLINNSISDLNALSALSNLKRLYLSNNAIADLSPLTNLQSLTFLNLRNNLISDVAPIANLGNINQLYLNDNQISDVSAIANLTRLLTLDLRNNAIGSVGVAYLDSLVSLQNASSILLAGNIDIACEELITLIDGLGRNIIDLDTNDISCDIPPRTPGNLQLLAGHERIIVTFDPIIEANNYRLYWSLNSGVDITTANRIDNVRPGFQHNGLTNGTVYYYVLTAINSSGESAPSIELSATPSQIPIAGLFADNNMQACIDDLASLNSWSTADEVSGVVNCSEKGISELSGIEHLASITTLSLNGNFISDVTHIGYLTKLTSLSLYSNNLINVQALENLTSLTDLFINQNSVNNAGPLSGLTQLQVLDLSNNRLGVNSIGNVDELAQLGSASMIKLDGNTEMSCLELDALINALPPGVLDLVSAKEGTNCTNPSLKPSGFRAVSGNNQITLSWNPVKNVDSYFIYWATAPGVDSITGNQITVQGTHFVHSGLINDNTYYYVVTSIRGTQESEISAELFAAPSANGVTLSGLFPDTQLRDCVNSIASANGWTFAHEITGTLNCSARQINEIGGIEYLTALEELRLGSNNIQDIAPLSALTNLTFLDLFNNAISDISSIGSLTNLATLYLHNNNITDIAALSALSVLDYLILDENAISDLSPLSALVGLSRLYLRANSFNSVIQLSSLTQLSELYINNNNIVDVSPLAGLVFLQQLDLRNNAIGGLGVGNLDSLAALTNVSKIRLSGNANLSCTELDALISVLGPNSTDLGESQPGVNCLDP